MRTVILIVALIALIFVALFVSPSLVVRSDDVRTPVPTMTKIDIPISPTPSPTKYDPPISPTPSPTKYDPPISPTPSPTCDIGVERISD